MSDGTVRVPGFGDWGVEGTYKVPTDPRGVRRALGVLEPGELLLDRYRVVETLHPHETRKPGVFICECEAYGRVIVKVAATDYPPKAELWEVLPTLLHRHVVRTFELQERNGLFYEVQECYEGGALNPENLPRHGREEWLMQTFVPSMAGALKYLHGRGIVHRDVKPANIYVRFTQTGKELVLGDFDISSQIAGDETSRATSRADATWRYSAPEALPLVQAMTGSVTATVSREVDYYSLGVAIIELLLGTTGLPGDQAELFTFYSTGRTISLPYGPDRLVTLLSGLLIRDRSLRWGAEQVERWLNGKTTPEDLEKIQKDRGWAVARRQPYKFGKIEAHDLRELARAMSESPTLAMADLQRGAISQWVHGIDTNVAREIDADREKLKREPEVALLAAILRCDPDLPFVLPNGQQVRTPAEWVEKSVSSLRHPAMAVDKIGMRRLEYWLRARRGGDDRLADRIAAIAPAEHTTFEEVAYALDPTLPFPMHGTLASYLADRKPLAARNPSELVSLAFGTPEDWVNGPPKSFQRAFDRFRHGYMAAWLRQRGYAEQAFEAEVAASQASTPEGSFDAFLRKIEPVPACEIVIDRRPIGGGLRVPFLERRYVELPYTSQGIGTPIGSLVLQEGPEGLRLLDIMVEGRTGTLRLEFDTRYARQARGEAVLRKGRGSFEIQGGCVPIPFEVLAPTRLVLKRTLGGAGIGAALLGGARLLGNLGTRGIPDGTDITWQRLAEATASGDFWTGGKYLLAMVLALCAMAGAFYLWLKALRGSER